LAIADGTLARYTVKVDERQVATVVLVSGGYPGPYEKGKNITGIEQITNSLVMHAGTRRDENGVLLTNGGRVLAITSFGETFQEALNISNANAAKIQFEGVNYRKDIGFDL